LENFKRICGIWFLGQVFHNIVAVGSSCVGIVCCALKNALWEVKQCIKIWFIYVKRATGLGRRYCFWRSMGRFRNVIFFGSSMQIDHLVIHKMVAFKEDPA
jgi:hypothetical protein